MANKRYKQTFKGRTGLPEVHEAIGRRGGLVVRIDQTDAGTTAYFEADEAAAKEMKAEESSLKEITRI